MSRVLVVHSDAALGARLGATLSAAGLEVRAVTSGERAMDRFIQEPADVLVVDYHLDGRDGVSTAEAIRWMPGGRGARLVLLAEHEPESGPLAELGRAVDAFETMVGPLEPAKVRAIVERAAAMRPPDPETRILASELAPAAFPRPRWDEPTAPTAETPLGDVAISVSQGMLDDQTLDEPAPAASELDDPEGNAEALEVATLAQAATGGEPFGEPGRGAFLTALGELAARRATGALVALHPGDDRPTLGGGPPVKVVYFRAGVPVHVRSNLAGESLAQALARHRAVPTELLRDSASAARRGEGRQEDLLLASGPLSPLELAEALAEQLRRKLFEAFAWTRATFVFLPDRRPPDELLDLDMGLAEIAFRGVRSAMPPEQAAAALGADGERYPIPSARGMVRFARLPIPDPLREVLRRIDGQRSVRELLSRAREPGRAAQLLLAMRCLGAVRLEDRPRGLGLAPRLERAREPELRATLPDHRDRQRTAESSPAPSAYAEGSTRLPSVPEAAVMAESVGGASVAWSPALDWSQEPTPLESVGLAPEPLPVTAARDGESAVRIAPPREAWEPEVPAPSRRDRPTDRPPRSEVPRAEPSSLSRPQPEVAPAGPRQLDDRVERLLAAERHARRGQSALDRGRPDEAEAALTKALALCPDEPRFVVLAAWARYAAQPEDAFVLSTSLTEAARACALDPQLALAHLLHARLLESAGRSDAAWEAYRRAHELDPEDEEARQKVAR